MNHVLQSAGWESAAGGNLGTAALALPELGDAGVYVLEMSSYMLERLTTLRFDAAALLNLSPDHLDRHGDMAGYIAAKRHIFDRAGAAVVGIDDRGQRGHRGRTRRASTVSGHQRADIWCDDGVLRDRPARSSRWRDAPALPGAHNAQNAAAAAALAAALGRRRAPRSPPGSPASPACRTGSSAWPTIDGVAWVNDSKATNADAAARALACYDRIVWIAGGQAKAGGIEPLRPFFPRIAHALLIGRDAAVLAATLARPACRTASCGTLEAAVPAARALAPQLGRDVVLLSPACASFDQFTGFEARGDRFAEARPCRPAPEDRLMPALSRADTSVLGRWWWTVDRWTLAAVATLIGFGYIMMLAASPAVADRIHVSHDMFIVKQVAFLLLAGVIVVTVSLFSPRGIRRLALLGCLISIALTALTLVHGVEVKGARRWINAARHEPAAQRVHQALLCGGDRLAAERSRAIALLPRHADRLRGSSRVIAAAAEVAARHGHAGGDRRGVLRAALRRRAEPADGRRRLRRHRRGGGRRLHASSRMCAAASTASSTRPPATTTRSTPRSRRSAMAGCSAADPAKAGSRTCCPTRMPTSSSPSWARSSA